MAKFVKLENGNYINVDMIITITPFNETTYFAYTMGFDSDFKNHRETLTITDLKSILRASEEQWKY